MTATTQGKPKTLSLNTETLRTICGLNGFTMETLSEHIGRTRQAIFYAARKPEDYPRTWALMDRALPIRQMPERRK